METLHQFMYAVDTRGLLTAVEAIVAGLGAGAGVWLIRRVQIALGVKDAREQKHATSSSSR